MKTTLLLTALLTCGTALIAADHKHGHSNKAETTKSAPAKNYPLKTCLVSDEPLGSMGDAVAYTHKEAGKPDRVILVCCEGCIDDFRANPAKFLKKLDAAEAAAKKQPGNKQS
jgi:hypothetical protein